MASFVAGRNRRGAEAFRFSPRIDKCCSMHAPAPQIIPPDTLLLAYRSGIFPMADSRTDTELFWVEPRQRAILPLDGYHCSHSLAKELRRGTFEVTCNRAFAEVIDACAALRKAGVRLRDCQFMTEHLASLGAVEISQQRYIELLAAACGVGLGDGVADGVPEAFAALVDEATGDSSPGKRIAQSFTHTS